MYSDMYSDLGLFIDGVFLSGEGRGGEPVLNPATGQSLATLPHATVADLDRAECYDTILYIDVLEHIETDAAEMAAAAELLRPGGHLAVLSPAFPWLFTEFDAAIGHHRRYTRGTLTALSPRSLVRRRCWYLDSVGLLASLANRFLLRASMPTKAQIRLWDRSFVPLSMWVDRLIGHSVGRSILAVWEKV